MMSNFKLKQEQEVLLNLGVKPVVIHRSLILRIIQTIKDSYRTAQFLPVLKWL